MYVPAHFQPPHDDPGSALADLLARAPLVDLITFGRRPDGSTGMVATPLPLLYDADRGPLGTLVGHVARNNPHWQMAGVAEAAAGGGAADSSGGAAAGPAGGGADPAGADPAGGGGDLATAAAAGDSGADSLVIVRGPDAYISPTWYASTAEHGRVVPTWNYLTAHVHGRLVAHDDVDWTYAAVRRLTEHFEAGFTPPWTVDDPPERFLAGQLRAIVGVEIVVTAIEAKYKLGQNRSAADVAGAVEGLSAGSASNQAVAADMATLLVNRP